MEQRQLRELLRRVATGETAIDEAERTLRIAPFTELGYATVDNHRGMRQGVSEVVYGAGKTAEQMCFQARTSDGADVLASPGRVTTRAGER